MKHEKGSMPAWAMVMLGILTLVVICPLLYLVSGYYTIHRAENKIDEKTGEVWVEIDAATEILGRLEAQMLIFLADRQDLYESIVSGRSEIVAARQSGDVTGTLDAVNGTLATFAEIQAVFEDNPEFDLSTQMTTLMDETAGAFRSISFARDELIKSQRAYNDALLTWPFMGEKVTILGSDQDPTDDSGVPNTIRDELDRRNAEE